MAEEEKIAVANLAKEEKLAAITLDKFSCGKDDGADCSVVSIASLCDITYLEAYNLAEIHGRKPNKGMSMRTLLTSIEKHVGCQKWDSFVYFPEIRYFKYLFKGLPKPATGRLKFYRKWKKMYSRNAQDYVPKKGKYLFLMEKHALTVIDGIKVDTSPSSNFLIRDIIEVKSW